MRNRRPSVPEPKDKLDTVTIRTVEARTASDADGMANGPEGDSTDWQSIDWQRAEEEVRRLRQRIFTASQAGDLKRVRNLQKLMLRSRSNTLVSVRRATEVNAGRKTAGIDGQVALTAWDRAALAMRLHRHGPLRGARPSSGFISPRRAASSARSGSQ